MIVPDVDPTNVQHFNNDNEDDSPPEFTMMAGEFLSLYRHFLPDNNQEQKSASKSPNSDRKSHAVVCSFFLDTAPSLPHYILTTYHMLEEGGLLIHFGPLMFHWSGHGSLVPGDLDTARLQQNGSANVHGDGSAYRRRNSHLDDRYLASVDYTWEEVRHMIVQCGFVIEEEELNIPARYTADARSMMKVEYDCSFLVARKKAAI